MKAPYWHIWNLWLALSLSLHASGPWEGFWESYSFGDDAYISLSQDKNKVIGTYFPYNGTIEGTDDGGVLRGTWASPNGTGKLVFTLSPDGESFAGTVGMGEWWNGKRIAEDEIDFIDIDVVSPSHTLRSFMRAGYALRRGKVTGLQAMFSTLQFEDSASFSLKSRQARLLYDVLHLTTFRVFDVRPEDDSNVFKYHFKQDISLLGPELTFVRDLFGIWRIVAPEESVLSDLLAQMLEARGLSEINPSQYRNLSTPRETMEAFMVGMETWETGGKLLVKDTFNLTALNEGLHGWQIPITAAIMTRNLNRVAQITLQEFPDNPASSKPFVFYTHPEGSIEIAPYIQEGGSVSWQFTPATLKQAKDLYDVLQSSPTNFANINSTMPEIPYFELRSKASRISSNLLIEKAGIELWQLISLLVLLFVLPGGLHLLLSRVEEHLSGGKAKALSSMRQRQGIMLRLLLMGSLWLLAAGFLGLATHISGPIHALGSIFIIIGLAWLLLLAINTGFQTLHDKARHTKSTTDDIVVSLLSGLSKILLFFMASIAVADVLGLPYQTVFAGFGIGGLAFAIASRDIIANLFGSAIIAADRPFKKGDFISLGTIQGTVEKVGLRTTKLRPLDDTAVMIPNATISTEQVVNITRRRKIRLVETIHIDHQATVAALNALRDRIRELLTADEMVADENIRIGLNTLSLYAVELNLACYIKTTNYDEFINQKHRIMVGVLEVIEASEATRAVIRRD